MRTLCLILSVFFFLSVPALATAPTIACKNAIRRIVEERWKGFPAGRLEANGVRYEPILKLGESGARVYLAVDPKGKKVSFKKLDLLFTYRSSLLYEQAATEFYKEQREEDPSFPYAPSVIAIDLKRSVIVKEYIEGLKEGEVGKLPQYGVSQANYRRILKEKEVAKEKLKNAHLKFREWLKRKNISIKDWPDAIKDFIDRGDVKDSNLIYSSQYGWVCIDP